MRLVIVESPTKARTLSRFLGDGYDAFATTGHIKDLPKSKLGVDIKKNFEPKYEVVAKRKSTIDELKKRAKGAKMIFLATDPDREGEAIAAHVKEIIGGGKSKRIVFHEITKEAVEEAIESPREVDVNLVDAQTARRVLDRLVGYQLSPLLWRKVRRGLSAGRVQTVAVRLIVEKEREIEAFKSEEFWEIYCDLKTGAQKTFSAKLAKTEVKNAKDAKSIVDTLEKSDYKVGSVNRREVRKNPFPPFTTSTMTQAAARVFGWSAKRTMQVAQRLYEEGLITYHRTDSTNIAANAVGKVRDYIAQKFGKEYVPEKPRFFKKTSKVAQEAHEAIRPTDVSVSYEGEHKKLYDLILRRFVACQMAASVYDQTRIDVTADMYLLRASGQVTKFEGWRTLFKSVKTPDDEQPLPDVAEGEALELIRVNSFQKFTEPPGRFNEASLIKTLEKLGIGRPSTYAPTITTIQLRQYVEKSEGKFFPTSVGIAVNDFLTQNFPDVFEYAFTAQMEDSLDKVADGKTSWVKTIKDFWTPFDKKLKTVTEKSKRVKIEVEKTGRKCPECNEGELVIRIGRFGKFISCSRFPDCKHTEKYVEKVGIKCPDCKEGDVIVKRSKRGKRFFGCSRYPECKWASWKLSASQESGKQEAD